MLNRIRCLMLSVIFVVLLLPQAGSAQMSDTINAYINVYNSAGREVTEKSEIKAGDYSVTVKASNLQQNDKQIDIYLAVTISGRLYSVKKSNVEILGKNYGAAREAQKSFNISIPKMVDGNVDIEAYYWSENMAPFSNKVVFAENQERIYNVYGRVVATHSSDPSVRKNEVIFALEKSDNFKGEEINSYNSFDSLMFYASDDVLDMLFIYSKAVVKVDSNDECTILSLTPAVSENSIIRFNAEDLDERTISMTGYSYSMTDNSLRVCTNGSVTQTTTYRLDENVGFYVNGYPIRESVSSQSAELASYIDRYIIDNPTGIVTLIDSPNKGVSLTDGKYDYIMVTYYKDAVVDCVIGDDEEATIHFSEIDVNMNSSMKVDTINEDVYYLFTINGNPIKVTDLRKGDVLSIAYTGNNFSYSNSYTVLVSRDKVEGQVTSKSPYDGVRTEFTVNGGIHGEAYKVASEFLVNPYSDIIVGNKYILSLDAFGRVAKVEETADSTKIAILENVYTANGDQYYATIVTPDGKKTTYTIKDKALYDTYRPLVYTSGDTKKAVHNRVFSYSVSSSTGNITIKGENGITDSYGLPIAYTPNGGVSEYRENVNRLGIIKLSGKATSILDLSDYYWDKSIIPMDIDDLVDGAEYTAYGYNKLSDGTYQFVLITEGGNGSQEIVYDTETIGILENVYTANGDQYYATIVAPDGKKATYTIMDKSLYDTYRPLVYTSYDVKKDVRNRVFGYSISSSTGNIIIKGEDGKVDSEYRPAAYTCNGGVVEYSDNTNSLGEIGLNKDTTSILDLSDYFEDKSIIPISMNTLVDSAEYVAYGYDKLSDGTYRLVLITEGGNGSEEVVYDADITGILENVYTANGDQYYASIVTPDGKKTTYTIMDKSLYNSYRSLVYNSGDTKFDVKDRVYECAISTSTDFIEIRNKIEATGGLVEYDEAGSQLGNIKLNKDATSVLDLSEYACDKSIVPMSINTLVDGAEYTAYGYNKLYDGTYQFVLITEGGSGAVTYKTEFVIYSKKTSEVVDGEVKTTYKVYEGGATTPTTIILDDDSVDVTLNEGDPIVVKKNSSGYVTEVNKLFEVDLGAGYDNFASTAREALKNNSLNGVVNIANADTTLNKGSGNNESRWIFGAVYDRTDRSITIATADNFNGTYVTDVMALEEYDVDADAGILVYNYKERAGKQLRVSNGVLSSIIKVATVKDASILDWDSSILTSDENAQYGRTSFIFAKTIDSDIVEAYVIVPSTSKN